MVFERNESKIANLLAKLDNLPAYDIGGFKRAVIEILVEQQKQIEEKAKVTVHGEYKADDITELELWFSGENYVFFQADRKQGKPIQTLCLKGEI